MRCITSGLILGMSQRECFVLFARKTSADAAFIRHSHDKPELTGNVAVSRGWRMLRQDKDCRRVLAFAGGNLESTVVVKNVDVFGSEEAIFDYFMQLGHILEHHVLWADQEGTGKYFLL